MYSCSMLSINMPSTYNIHPEKFDGNIFSLVLCLSVAWQHYGIENLYCDKIFHDYEQ